MRHDRPVHQDRRSVDSSREKCLHRFPGDEAVQLALQAFVTAKSNIHIFLLIDNSTAIAYVNHKGVTHSKALSNLALEIWDWCISRQISLHAEHIPGVANIVADAELKNALEPGDKIVFHALQKVWGPFNVDLFAVHHNSQLP